VRNALISKDSEDKNTCTCAALYSATVAEPVRDDDTDEDEEDSSDVDGSKDSSSGEEDSSGGANPPTPPKRMYGNSRKEAPVDESTGERSSHENYVPILRRNRTVEQSGWVCGNLREEEAVEESTGGQSSDQM
jgi:hypothetical protein